MTETSSNTDVAVDEHLDVTGLKCPLPVLKARKALSKLPEGAVLEVLATDPAAMLDFRHYAKQSGHELLLSEETDAVLRFLLRKTA